MKRALKRLVQMPPVLLLLSFLPWLMMTLLFFTSLSADFQLNFHGRLISHDQWWESGGGGLIAIGLVIFSIQLGASLVQTRGAGLIISGAWISFGVAEFMIGPQIDAALLGEATDSWTAIAAGSFLWGVVALIVTTFASSPRKFLTKEHNE